ncbi:PAQR family membrane homeostasis protein TrhA [Treponema primitia]|uniref:PAQR family membrane homeostasis protein TrhA n=1 Tax=Treponema primitia TaxID=88058 RepID=UPI000255530D|nr:hemolysin III family protein [Treponema primitia]
MKDSLNHVKMPASKAAVLPLPFQTLGEEIANAVLHGLGALLAVVGLVLLVLRGKGYLGIAAAETKTVVAYVIFTAAMICMFLASTLYHAVQHTGAKRILRILDHSAIYLFIAGSYTPFCLVGLKGAWGWAIFGAEWALAAAGISLHAVNYRPLKKLELVVYILMGWAIVIATVPLVRSISRLSLILLAAGGVAYTLGALFYRKHEVRGAHVTWHAFVLAGAFCHWLSIWWL